MALSMDTLYAQMNGETRTLADRLIEQGIFTQESWNSVKKDFEHAKGIVQTPGAGEHIGVAALSVSDSRRRAVRDR